MLGIPETYERVIYDKSPLFEVICQVRFPTILRVASQTPVDFQERVRLDYPVFEKSSTTIPQQFRDVFKDAGIKLPGEYSYEFKTEEHTWKISLSKESIALSTTTYNKFEEFKERFEVMLSMFQDVYKPSYFSRVGLRYQNLIIRSRLGLEEWSWKEIISPKLASELNDQDISESLKYYLKHLVFDIGNDEVLAVRHGIVETTTDSSEKGEEAYLLDSDFYSASKLTEEKDVIAAISRFNRSTGRLFRWSISDLLHEAMEPRIIQG